jgi:hypothetical protein
MENSFASHLKPIGFSCILFFVLLFALSLGSYHSRDVQIEKASVVLKNRIALDLIDLGLESSNGKMTQDNKTVRYYINNLNEYLEDTEFPLRVYKIEHYEALDFEPQNTKTIELQNTRNTIPIVVEVVSSIVNWWSITLPALLSIAFYALFFFSSNQEGVTQVSATKEEDKTPPKLLIDLRDRTIYLNSAPEHKSTLSNKPLCFYLAMLTYCCQNATPQLFHNKQLPEDFLALANKYFSRLLELGHSRRKRPDFDNNIDKMLSEIRTALEEILAEQAELKKIFFPQKAQGEGSRSKLHNFALTELTAESFELIGN